MSQHATSSPQSLRSTFSYSQSATSTHDILELPWEVPTVRGRWEQRIDTITEEQKTAAWAEVIGSVKTYSDEMVTRWNNEMDTLLVYSGVFSAVLTAFNVQSYQLLHPSTSDPMLVALHQLSLQVHSLSNSTHPAAAQPTFPSSPPPRSAIWLNTLWFSSLICSLSAASLGIMIKHWLNAFNTGISGTSRETARLRQRRLDSLVKWRVPEIIAIMPVLLQLALALFLAGLLVLLWTLNDTVAIVASCLVGILALSALAAIVTPAFASDCAYVSPPSVAFYHILFRARHLYHRFCHFLSQVLPMSITDALHIHHHILLHQSDFSWHLRERKHVTKTQKILDARSVATAYNVTHDLSYLTCAMACTTDIGPADLIRCFADIGGDHRRYNPYAQLPVLIPRDLHSDVLLALLAVEPVHRVEDWEDTLYKWREVRQKSLPSGSARCSYAVVNYASLLSDNTRPELDLKWSMQVLRELYDTLKDMREADIPLTSDARRCASTAASRHLESIESKELSEIPRLWDELRLCLKVLIECTVMSDGSTTSSTAHDDFSTGTTDSSAICDYVRRTVDALVIKLTRSTQPVMGWLEIQAMRDVSDALCQYEVHSPNPLLSPATRAVFQNVLQRTPAGRVKVHRGHAC